MSEPETTELQLATIALNHAIDAFWMDSVRGLGLTGMGSNHMDAITDAQAACRKALEAEGVQINVESRNHRRMAAH